MTRKPLDFCEPRPGSSIKRPLIWDGLPVLRELSPAYEKAKNQGCIARKNGMSVRCQYYDDCRDNVQRNGALLCERLFVLDADGTEVLV